jgi:hypothetical protein
MGGSGSTLGLAFEITADPEHAGAALEQFEQSLKSSLDAATGHLGVFQGAWDTLSSHFVITAADLEHVGHVIMEGALSAAHFGEEMVRASQRTGMTVEQLSALKFAAEQTGTTFEGVQKSLGLFSRNVADLSGKANPATKELERMGIATRDAHGHILPLHDLLLQVAERFSKEADGATKSAEAMALFGRSGRELIPLLDKGAAGIKELEERARELGVTMSDGDARAAANLGEEVKALDAELEGIKRRLSMELVPAFSLIAETLLGNKEAWIVWGKGVEVVVFQAGKVAAEFGEKLASLPLIGDKGAAKQFLEVIREANAEILEAQTEGLAAEQAMLAELNKVGAAATDDTPGAAAGGGKEKGEKEYRTPLKDFISYGPTLQQLGIVVGSTEGAFAHFGSTVWDGVSSLNIWMGKMENMEQELPLVQSHLENMAAALAPPTGSGYGGYAVGTTSGGVVSIAAHAAKVAVDGLMASMDSAGGKSSAFSNKMFQAANAMGAMAKQAQDAGKGRAKGGKDAGKGVGKGGKDAGKGVGKGWKAAGVYAVSIAAHAAKVAVDGLMASMDSAGGKSSAFSNKMFQAANAMAAMAKQAQDAADKGETVDPAQQIAGMVQIAAAAILTYKERSILEAVYYAAKSAAAFASGDYWAGAEYALASGLFAEAAGTASKAASATGGASSATGGNQSSYGGAPGGGAGGGGAGAGSKGATIIWQQTGPIGNCPTCMANFARTLAGVQNALVGSGQLKIVATTAITKGPTQT